MRRVVSLIPGMAWSSLTLTDNYVHTHTEVGFSNQGLRDDTQD